MKTIIYIFILFLIMSGLILAKNNNSNQFVNLQYNNPMDEEIKNASTNQIQNDNIVDLFSRLDK